MLTIEEFKKEIEKEVSLYFMGEKSVKVRSMEVQKNNGVILHGLEINNGTTVSPVIYLDDEYRRYKEGKSVDECKETIVKVYKENCTVNFEVDDFTNYAYVKEKIFMKLVNLVQNQKMLENVPHYTYGDLAVIFQVIIQTPELENASITINYNRMNAWNTTLKELMQTASKNINKQPIYIQSMKEVMLELMDELPEDIGGILDTPEPMMYVMSNKTKINGAAAMVCVEKFQEFAEKLDNNFYVLPSSVHEIILVPDEGDLDVEQLKNMVMNVNKTQVAPDEVLSDHVYFYDKEIKHLVIAETREPMILRPSKKI